MVLSYEDFGFICRLKELEILVDVEEYRLDQTNGVVLVSCGDADQMPDIFRHQMKMQNGQRENPRVHTLTWNGGAARLPKDSPMNEPGLLSDITFMKEIADAVWLKNIKTIALYIHTPCGKTANCRMSFQDSIHLVIKAKLRIKNEIPDIRVACFCHVDYGDRKKTKFVSRQQYEKYRHLIIS